MSNQEGLFKYDENMDFSLDLTSDLPNETKQNENDTRPFEETIDNSMDEIKKLMKERNELSKSKESITYGITTGKFPTWLKVNTYSLFHVSNVEDTAKFNELWSSVAKEGTKQHYAENDYILREKKVFK